MGDDQLTIWPSCKSEKSTLVLTFGQFDLAAKQIDASYGIG
jgi:hypothetical protein